jgi:hypothetical protein
MKQVLFASQILILGSQAKFVEDQMKATDPTLHYTFELVRHGARAPLIDADAGRFPVVAGMLTPMGARQRAVKGELNREHFSTQKDFIDATFNPENVKIISDDVFRTIQSAKSEMTGLFPPGTAREMKESELKALQEDMIVPFKVRNKDMIDQELGN